MNNGPVSRRSPAWAAAVTSSSARASWTWSSSGTGLSSAAMSWRQVPASEANPASLPEASPSRTNRARRASWWVHSAVRARRRASSSTGPAVSMTTDWLKKSGCAGRGSRNQCWIGVRSAGPATGSVPATAGAASPPEAASSATVGCRKRSRGVRVSPAARARETTWMLRMESPPSMKKLSSTPTCSRPSSSAQIPARMRSVSVRGARWARSAPADQSGAGSRRRSTLPLAVSGSSGTVTNAAGSM